MPLPEIHTNLRFAPYSAREVRQHKLTTNTPTDRTVTSWAKAVKAIRMLKTKSVTDGPTNRHSEL